MIQELTLSVLSLLCGAQDSPFSVPRGPRLLLDQQTDGTVWIRGQDYKLSLSRTGARFFPRDRRSRHSHELQFLPVQVSSGKGSTVAANSTP